MNIIAEITDKMFGIEEIPFNNPTIRYGARGIIKRDDGLIAVFYKQAKNEYKLPGGGIDEGEEPETAFKREALEETGCEVEDIKFLGITKELKSQENFQQTSYVFASRVTKDTGTLQMTQKEIDEGGGLVWLEPKEALAKIINCAGQLKESDYDSVYRTKFMNYRDREILRYYIENCCELQGENTKEN